MKADDNLRPLLMILIEKNGYIPPSLKIPLNDLWSHPTAADGPAYHGWWFHPIKAEDPTNQDWSYHPTTDDSLIQRLKTTVPTTADDTVLASTSHHCWWWDPAKADGSTLPTSMTVRLPSVMMVELMHLVDLLVHRLVLGNGQRNDEGNDWMLLHVFKHLLHSNLAYQVKLITLRRLQKCRYQYGE